MSEQQRRAAAKPKEVTEIDPQNDIRVRVTGTVISKEEDSIALDDSTGTVDVFMQEDELNGIEEGGRIRVIGRVLPTPDSFEIQAEVVQDFSDVDPELESRVNKVVSESE